MHFRRGGTNTVESMREMINMDEQHHYNTLKGIADALPKLQWTFVRCQQCGRTIVYEGIRTDVTHPKDCEDCKHWNDLK